MVGQILFFCLFYFASLFLIVCFGFLLGSFIWLLFASFLVFVCFFCWVFFVCFQEISYPLHIYLLTSFTLNSFEFHRSVPQRPEGKTLDFPYLNVFPK